MLPGSPIRTRFLAPEDPALHPGWPLLDFLMSIGCDEFAVTFMYSGDARAACGQLAGRLAFSSLGDRTRERTVTYAGQQNPRAAEGWRLDPSALVALREVMPAGVLGQPHVRDAWAEDFCVYRQSALVLGVVTHEDLAFLRLTDAEWRRWSRRSAAQRRAT